MNRFKREIGLALRRQRRSAIDLSISSGIGSDKSGSLRADS